MPQVRTLITTVADASIKTEPQARAAFWDRMETANGGREGDPRDYISIIEPVVRDARGFVFRYEVPAEVLDSFRAPEESAVLAASEASKEELPVSSIMITGWNPRKAFDPEALQALAEDIRQNGLINAVTVRPKGKSKYELVAGERRLRAFRLLGRATIPAKVRELTDEQVLDIMLAENLQRIDLNPIEEAHHLKRVLEVGKLTQTELGRRVGKSQEWVSQRLRLAEAPGVLQDLIIRRRINTSSAIEVLQWRNTEHYDAIMQEIGAWSVEGEELPRARVREIIKEITEPVITLQPKDPTCMDCGNSTWSDGKLICAHHGQVNPDGRYCEKFVAPSLGDDDAPVSEGEITEPTDLPFVNPEDCKDCDIYDREKNECPEGCTCDSECEDSFCEVTDDGDEKQDLPDEPEPVADPADMAVGLKRNAMILELAKNRPMNCTCERDPWDNGVRTFECRICHEVFIDQKGMEAFVMVRHLIGDGYHSDHRDAAQAVLAKAHLQPIKEALQRYFVGGSEVEDDVRIREQEADVAVNDFDRQSGFGGPSYMEEQCRAGNKDAIEARKARNKLTEARLNIRKEAEARGVRL